ncbi:MAG: hypothetical protein AB1405_12615, partial [Bdellovibrionota bacterium]
GRGPFARGGPVGGIGGFLAALAVLGAGPAVPAAKDTPPPAYEKPQYLHDTPGHDLGQGLLPRFSKGGADYEKLLKPGAKAAYDAELVHRLFATSTLTFLNAVVEILPPDQSKALVDEPVAIGLELLDDRTTDALLVALSSYHRDDLLLPLSDLTEAAGALDLETGQRLVTPAAQDFLELLEDARVRKVVANIHEISRAELDFDTKTSPDVASFAASAGRTTFEVTPEDYDRGVKLLNSLYEGGAIEHFSRYAQANYPFASKQNPIIRLAEPLECVFDPKGRRGLYRASRTQGIILANVKDLEDLSILLLDNLDRFTEPAGLEMFYNIFRYPRLPQLVEGYHLSVEQGKFDNVVLNIARLAAGEDPSAVKTPGDGLESRDKLANTFQEYMKSGQRTRLVLYLTGQSIALLGELSDVHLKSEPRRTMLNESIDFLTYLLVGDPKNGINPVADPVLDTLFGILLDDVKSERFFRVLSETSRIILNPPSGLDVKDLDNQLSDILKCDPPLEFAAVLRDQLDGNPSNGDAHPAVPILKLLAKADPKLVAVALRQSGRHTEKGHDEKLFVFFKRIYEAEKPDWYPIISLSEEIFKAKRGGKSIFERGGQIAALSLPEGAKGKLPVLQGIFSEKHAPDLLGLYKQFQRVLLQPEKPGKKGAAETGLSVVERLAPGAGTLARAADPFTGKPLVDDLVILLDAAHHSGLDDATLDLLVVLQDQGLFDRNKTPNVMSTVGDIFKEIQKTRKKQLELLERMKKPPQAAKK